MVPTISPTRVSTISAIQISPYDLCLYNLDFSSRASASTSIIFFDSPLLSTIIASGTLAAYWR
ncbi:unnamed protein product, partial [Linum tenue]